MQCFVTGKYAAEPGVAAHFNALLRWNYNNLPSGINYDFSGLLPNFRTFLARLDME